MINNFNITAPLRELSKAEETLNKAETDLIEYGKFFLPGDFLKSQPTPQFHHEVAAAMMGTNWEQQLALIIARGHGKTTLIKAFILNQISYRKRDEPPLYIGWISSTIGKSRGNIDYISQHIEHNSRIIRYFGKMGGRGYSNLWNKDEIRTRHGDTVVSRSNIRSIRGENIASIIGGAQRYHLVIPDDIEDLENTKTPEGRKFLRKNFTNSVYPALAEGEGRLIFAGTPVHPDSLCQSILDGYLKAKARGEEDRYSWNVLYYKATQPNMEGGVLWHSYIPRESLNRKKQFFIDTYYGDDSGYYQEYELEPQGRKNVIWTRDHYIIHDALYIWDSINEQSFLQWRNEIFAVNCFLGSDPATDIDTRFSSNSVVMVIAICALWRIFVLDYISERSIPQIGLRNTEGKLIGKEGVVDHIFDKYDRYHCLSATVEDVAMTRGVWQDLDAEKERRTRWDLVLNGISPEGKNKNNKIVKGLNKHFTHRRIYVRQNHYNLRDQIINMGPNLSVNDEIETLYFCIVNGYPPKDGIQIHTTLKKKKKVKSWTVA